MTEKYLTDKVLAIAMDSKSETMTVERSDLTKLSDYQLQQLISLLGIEHVYLSSYFISRRTEKEKTNGSEEIDTPTTKD